MTVAYFVIVLSLPLIALGVILPIVLPRHVVQSKPFRFVIFCLVVGPALALYKYRFQSGLNLFIEDLLVIPASCSAIWGGVYVWRNADKLIKIRSPKLSGVAACLAGVLLLVYSVILVNGDYLHKRRDIEGVVTKKYIKYERFGLRYYIEIDGRKYPTTADIYAQIEPEHRIHAAVGRVSKNIFAAD